VATQRYGLILGNGLKLEGLTNTINNHQTASYPIAIQPHEKT